MRGIYGKENAVYVRIMCSLVLLLRVRGYLCE